MLPKSERLTKKDFTGKYPKVFFRGAICDIATLPSTTPRFACVISKKTIRRAVDRNTARRKFYTAIRQITTKKNAGFVIYPKKETHELPYEVIKSALEEGFATLQ